MLERGCHGRRKTRALPTPASELPPSHFGVGSWKLGIEMALLPSEAAVKRFILAVLILGLSGAVAADEGMWTFDNVPKAEVAKRYGVQMSDQSLTHLQESVVRLETGCTGSFVSAEGLILTNHHCVAEC